MLGIIPLILTTIFGLSLTYIITKNLDRFERLGLAFILGLGLQTLFMFLFYLVGIRFTLINLNLEIIFLTTINILLLFLLKRMSLFLEYIKSFSAMKSQITSWIKHKTLVEKLFIYVLSFLILLSFIIGVYWPVSGWDSLVLFDFRAITFVATGGMEDGIARGYFFGYPLLTSLAHTWLYFFNGNPHLAYWGLYVSFVFILYATLSQLTVAVIVIWATFLVAIFLPLYTGSYFDYTNMPYIVYILSGIFYLLRWHKERKGEFLIVAMILTGLSTWTRETEPFWVINLLFALIVTLLSFRKDLIRVFILLILSFIIFFAIQQPWKLYETKLIGGPRNITDQANFGVQAISNLDFSLLWDIVSTTWTGTVPTWQPFFYISLLAIALNLKKLTKYWLIVGIMGGNVLLLFFGTYVFSLIWAEGWKGIIESQQRLSTFLIPLFIITIVIFSEDHIKQGIQILKEYFKGR